MRTLTPALAFAVVVGLLVAPHRAVADDPAIAVPHTHTDFTSYTLSLTWQPVFCGGTPGCDADQPHTPLIGLHGLWASEPQSLIAQSVPTEMWWRRGCDLLQHSDDAPALAAIVKAATLAEMPHDTPSLLVHEYDKHVQCFAFDPNAFFATEVRMHDALATSSFGAFLVAHVGANLTHADAVAAFDRAFGAEHEKTLSLVCVHDRHDPQQSDLSEIRVTVAADRLANFPGGTSLIDAPIPQDTCPATFSLPPWPSS